MPTVGLSIDTIASWIRTLLKLDPPNYLSGEGKLWLRLRLKDKEIYRSVIGADLDRPDGLFSDAVPQIFKQTDPILVGLAESSSGHPQQALEIAQQIIYGPPRSDEDLSRAYNLEAIVLSQMHDKDRLGKVLKTAIAHDPKDADPHETMGIALLEEGKFDDAIKEFKRAIALD